MQQFKRLDAEDLDLILKTLKEFADREAPLDKRLEWDEQDVCPESVVRAMLGPGGRPPPGVPPGRVRRHGRRRLRRVPAVDASSRRSISGLATAMLAVALGTDPIRVGCTHEQKAKWITRIANEGLIVAYGVTEPEAGSNVQNLKTDGRADHRRERPRHALQAERREAVHLERVDRRPLHDPREGARRPDLLRRRAQDAGPHARASTRSSTASASPTRRRCCSRTSSSPPTNIVGEKEGEGLKQANEVFGYTRLMVAAFGLGAGLAALEKAIAFSKERKQFGTLPVREAGLHAQAARAEQRPAGGGAGLHRVRRRPARLGHEDRQVEGSVAKLFATEVGNIAADDAVQALGGYGYCVDYEVEKIRRDARILTHLRGHVRDPAEHHRRLPHARERAQQGPASTTAMAAEVEGLDRGRRPGRRAGGAVPVRRDAAWRSAPS